MFLILLLFNLSVISLLLSPPDLRDQHYTLFNILFASVSDSPSVDAFFIIFFFDFRLESSHLQISEPFTFTLLLSANLLTSLLTDDMTPGLPLCSISPKKLLFMCFISFVV